MNFQFFNSQTKIIITIAFLLIMGGAFWFYQDYKKTQAEVQKAENELAPAGFDKFYDKKGNKFCVKAGDREKQEEIVNDMLWELGDQAGARDIKKVECRGGGIGIEIK